MKHLILVITSILMFTSLTFGGTDYLDTPGDSVIETHISLESLQAIATSESVKKLASKMYEAYVDYVNLMNSQNARLELQRRGIEEEKPFPEQQFKYYVLLTAGILAKHIRDIDSKPDEQQFIKYFMNMDQDFAQNVYTMYLALSTKR